MINTISLLGAWVAGVVGVGLAPVPVPGSGFDADPIGLPDHQAPPVQIWVDEGTDLFHRGDRVGLRFRTTEDMYLAVFHLDTDGQLEMLYPQSVWDQAFVRAHRTHALPGPGGRLTLGGPPGIGYFYVVASPFPLDLRAALPRSGLAGGGLRHVVRGDPFWALEELTLLLVRDRQRRRYAVDVYSYHIGGRHLFPAYACYDRFQRGIVDRYSYYPSCDRLRRLLVTYPYYYDTRRYRGDRAVYLRELHDLAPAHGYKEATGGAPPPPLRPAPGRGEPARAEPDRGGRRWPAEAPTLPVREREERRVEPARSTPARSRPTLERRPPERGEDRAQPPRGAAPPRAAPERGGAGRDGGADARQPRPAAPPPRSEPPRQSTPPREPPADRERPQPADRRPPPTDPQIAVDPAGGAMIAGTAAG